MSDEIEGYEQSPALQELGAQMELVGKLAAKAMEDLAESLTPLWDAIQEMARKLAEMLAPVVRAIVEYFAPYVTEYYRLLELSQDWEPAYRAYVVKLNWKRPRGKKLSWRSLNRPQRHTAIAEWLIEHKQEWS